jgi:hypothetical protein
MELLLNNKKISLLNLLIDFFALQYDLVYDFFKFLFDYTKWLVSPSK